MQIIVSGKQVDVGDALQTHVQDHLKSTVTKYFERAMDAKVVFSKEKPGFFKAHIMVHEGSNTGIAIVGDSEALQDIYAAFDDALRRVKKQLERYKKRIKSHHRPHQKDIELMKAVHYVMPANQDQNEVPSEESPIIIAEEASPIETLSVSDAVMRMDLSGVSALMFVHSKTNRLNFVYLRKDGNVAWVDPKDAP